MRRSGILNAQLAELINHLGHTDTFAVADCGLPVPAGVEVVDLAMVFGVPGWVDVVTPLLDEVIVEGAVFAHEAPQLVRDAIPAGVEAAEINHDELKAAVSDCKFVVRTGDTTPYANVIFRSGVPF